MATAQVTMVLAHKGWSRSYLERWRSRGAQCCTQALIELMVTIAFVVRHVCLLHVSFVPAEYVRVSEWSSVCPGLEFCPDQGVQP